MKIKTAQFGEVEINAKEIIHFPEGILGFEEIKDYVLLEEDGVFFWLQSIKVPSLCFLVIEPRLFMFNYSLDIPDEDVEFLKIKTPEDVKIISIVTVPEDPSKMTANLQGPIVINSSEMLAKQIISTNPSHRLKVPVLKELEKNLKRLEKEVDEGEA